MIEWGWGRTVCHGKRPCGNCPAENWHSKQKSKGGFTQHILLHSRYLSGYLEKGTLMGTVTKPPCTHGGQWSRRGPVWNTYALFSQPVHFLCWTEKRNLPLFCPAQKAYNRAIEKVENRASVDEMGVLLLYSPLWARDSAITVPVRLHFFTAAKLFPYTHATLQPIILLIGLVQTSRKDRSHGTAAAGGISCE